MATKKSTKTQPVRRGTPRGTLRRVPGFTNNEREWLLSWWASHWTQPRDGEVKALRELAEIVALFIEKAEKGTR